MGSTTSPSGGTQNPAAQAQLAATPSSASFPNVTAGSSSSQTITLSNNGTGAVTVSNVAVTGAGFGTSGLSLPLTIAAGQNSAFNVTFNPPSAASGNVSGTVSLMSNAANSALTIGASGSVIAATRLLTANPTSLSFGNVTLGTNSSLPATLTNTGNANVTISNVALNGAEFSVSGAGSNLVLAPSQSATLSATFAPNVTGAASGTIAVASDASNALTISISGMGVQASPYTVTLNWTPSTSTVVGYYVYRQSGTGATYTRLTAMPLALTDYQDASVQTGQTYTYVVTAVDADANESGYSNAAAATIP